MFSTTTAATTTGTATTTTNSSSANTNNTTATCTVSSSTSTTANSVFYFTRVGRLFSVPHASNVSRVFRTWLWGKLREAFAERRRASFFFGYQTFGGSDGMPINLVNTWRLS